MATTVLALNAGSSSLKFAVFDQAGAALLRGSVDEIGKAPRVSVRDRHRRCLEGPDLRGLHEDIVTTLLHWLPGQLGDAAIEAVGHRIVHGGPDFAAPVRVDSTVLDALEALVPFAPLHQPQGLAAIRAVTALRPALPQVACFDTAFHATMPPVATRLPLPVVFDQAGLRRYGFHGLSYDFVTGRLQALAPALARGLVVIAHLGSGASLCALRDGRSIDTTMGFSTLDGLVMATRPGLLDAGVVLYLLQERRMSADAIADLLYHHAGLLGVSGSSGDMRNLADAGTQDAEAAIALFIYRLIGEIGRMAACLGGLDGLVFTAGIGEHDPGLRAAVCAGLAWLGAAVDPAANASGGGRISATASAIDLWVIPTDEETVIARQTRKLVA